MPGRDHHVESLHSRRGGPSVYDGHIGRNMAALRVALGLTPKVFRLLVRHGPPHKQFRVACFASGNVPVIDMSRGDQGRVPEDVP